MSASVTNNAQPAMKKKGKRVNKIRALLRMAQTVEVEKITWAL